MEEIGIRLPGERGFTLSANSTFLGEFDLLGFNNQFIRGENNKGFDSTVKTCSKLLVSVCIYLLQGKDLINFVFAYFIVILEFIQYLLWRLDLWQV